MPDEGGEQKFKGLGGLVSCGSAFVFDKQEEDFVGAGDEKGRARDESVDEEGLGVSIFDDLWVFWRPRRAFTARLKDGSLARRKSRRR